MPYCEISDRSQMSKTIIAVKHFALGGPESLETAVRRRCIHIPMPYHKIHISSLRLKESLF